LEKINNIDEEFENKKKALPSWSIGAAEQGRINVTVTL